MVNTAPSGGTFYGLGIGPGDPELITLKALAILKAAPVIAYPAPENGESLTRAIAAPHLPGGQIEIPVPTPIVAERFPPRAAYDRAAGEIAAHLREGRDVAWLSEGDPLFYGSFLYLHARLAEAHRVEVVPGVCSLHACAAAAGRPLVARSQALTVVPAPLSEAELERRLHGAEAAAVVKVGRHLGKVRRVLGRLGLAEAAVYVERATLAAERVLPLAAVAGDEAPYFSMILIAGEGEEVR
jgi:precorrin-2/cobalt-factor-2 C20-methyltransferase